MGFLNELTIRQLISTSMSHKVNVSCIHAFGKGLKSLFAEKISWRFPVQWRFMARSRAYFEKIPATNDDSTTTTRYYLTTEILELPGTREIKIQ